MGAWSLWDTKLLHARRAEGRWQTGVGGAAQTKVVGVPAWGSHGDTLHITIYKQFSLHIYIYIYMYA